MIDILKKVITIGTRVILYLFIIFPILKSILTFGNGPVGAVIGWILAVLLTAFIVSILEVRGITKKLVGFLTSWGEKKIKSSIGEETILSKTVVVCPNCGETNEFSGLKKNCSCCGTLLTSHSANSVARVTVCPNCGERFTKSEGSSHCPSCGSIVN